MSFAVQGSHTVIKQVVSRVTYARIRRVGWMAVNTSVNQQQSGAYNREEAGKITGTEAVLVYRSKYFFFFLDIKLQKQENQDRKVIHAETPAC